VSHQRRVGFEAVGMAWARHDRGARTGSTARVVVDGSLSESTRRTAARHLQHGRNNRTTSGDRSGGHGDYRHRPRAGCAEQECSSHSTSPTSGAIGAHLRRYLLAHTREALRTTRLRSSCPRRTGRSTGRRRGRCQSVTRRRRQNTSSRFRPGKRVPVRRDEDTVDRREVRVESGYVDDTGRSSRWIAGQSKMRDQALRAVGHKVGYVRPITPSRSVRLVKRLQACAGWDRSTSQASWSTTSIGVGGQRRSVHRRRLDRPFRFRVGGC
jgi:hypothetical protein